MVASHCTNSEGDVGGVDDANIHQPTKHLVGNGNKVAEETVDPEVNWMDHEQCETGYYCRYSDAAFAELDSEDDINLGKVAKPTGVGETDVSPAGATFTITSEGAIGYGDDIYYISRKNGWQTARILDTCARVTVKAKTGWEMGVRLVCMGKAVVTGSSAKPANGDSGSPVIGPLSGNSVKLLGTVSHAMPTPRTCSTSQSSALSTTSSGLRCAGTRAFRGVSAAVSGHSNQS